MVDKIKKFAENEAIEFTRHAREKMFKRGINTIDVKQALIEGEIIQKCPVCGGELRKSNIKEEVWIEGKLLVIDNLTAFVCNHCNESIVDYPTMRKIENLIERFKHKKLTGTEFIAYEIDAAAEINA